jgi:hypothetical protein
MGVKGWKRRVGKGYVEENCGGDRGLKWDVEPRRDRGERGLSENELTYAIN